MDCLLYVSLAFMNCIIISMVETGTNYKHTTMGFGEWVCLQHQVKLFTNLPKKKTGQALYKEEQVHGFTFA